MTGRYGVGQNRTELDMAGQGMLILGMIKQDIGGQGRTVLSRTVRTSVRYGRAAQCLMHHYRPVLGRPGMPGLGRVRAGCCWAGQDRSLLCRVGRSRPVSGRDGWDLPLLGR